MSTSLELVKAEVLPDGPTLAELAATANREHGLVIDAGTSMIDHAIRAGTALAAAKSQCEYGTWREWLSANFHASPATATGYMRVAEYQHVIRENLERPTLHDSLRYLRSLPNTRADGYSPIADDVRDEAIRLHRSQVPIREIARLLDVNRGTVKRWVIPGYRAKIEADARQRHARRKMERLAQERAVREQAIKRALVAEGQAFNEAYTVISRLDGLLGQARAEAKTREKRLAINEAHALRDKMMDTLIGALGIE